MTSPFIQLVTFYTKSAEKRQELLDIWRPGYDYVREHEVPANVTYSYEGYLPADNHNSEDSIVIAYESYESESRFNSVHMTHPVILSFLQQLDARRTLSKATHLQFVKSSGVGFHSRGANREQAIIQSKQQPYALIVYITLKHEDQVEKFVSSFRPLSDHVIGHEPNTLTYHLMLDVKDNTKLVIFERYVHKDDLYVVHHQSAPFIQFQQELGQLNIIQSIEKIELNELQWGHWGSQ